MFGSYPDVVVHAGDEIDRIREIGKGYLYKDILKYDEIKRPELIDKLSHPCLRLLPLQQTRTGSAVTKVHEKV